MTAAPDAAGAEALAGAALALARRFAAGGTLWCSAPRWPAHSQHVAVEFVHPVIVGKRALPAVALEGRDPVADLRLLARPGDSLLAVDAAGDATDDLLRRARAWGLLTVWLGAGARPLDPPADHVIWVEGDDAQLAATSGELVLRYHVLWELTHVVFEHPGLLAPEPQCATEACVTCSDGADVAEVRSCGGGPLAEVMADGRPVTVDVSLLEAVEPGDLVLVHAGVAISRVAQGAR